jgi:curved DNA-binding protein CbpA
MSGKALTYYELLRVSPRAEPDRVRTAYRKLAQQYHPDKMPGDARAGQLMAALNEAYAVLSDPKQRARYDEHLEAIRASRLRARASLIARLEDNGASWPWVLLCATIAFAAAAVSVSMWPALIAARLLH